MQVILIKDVNKLGAYNELVTVKDGYARNYLIPQKLAVEASHSNLKLMEERNKVQQQKEQKMLEEIAQVKEALSAEPLKLGAKTGTSGKIFGSITTLQLSRAIKEQKGYEINRKHIEILDEIKELGSYNAKISFPNKQEIDLSFEVVGD